MRILLVTPAYTRVNERWMPLGICYIAGALIKKGHDVKIFDRHVAVIKHGKIAVDAMMA